ncbi:zinc finger protein ZAT9-like [Cornus florida]|uniref:zinc finger protein ZAT9-like n=1 Tax=Cornus florida TaxID=4283 RepID=UPI00289C3748|nr:zinc finger protein ZAT9-like [Cornus florida]
MEKYRCKLCLKKFGNGRALGGHMRSHMLNLYVPPKTERQPSDQLIQLSDETESASSSFSSSSSEEEEENEEKELGYGLRENPKKSIRWVDPHFSYAVDAGSVVLQDGESETESSKNPTQRRSKRVRKSGITEQNQFHDNNSRNPEEKKLKSAKLGATESSWAEQEPVSSISDTTPEEDVAYCLMMLSRDKWDEPEKEESEESDKIGNDSELKTQSKTRIRGKYKCETCDKVFKSYQALGGHRASHKKNNTLESRSKVQARNAGSSTMAGEKIHECPVCYRVFSSGQALGGHKRSHVVTFSATSSTPPHPTTNPKSGENLIDLNLPAPIDDDCVSQVEFSAVSDAEIFNPIKH